MSRAASRSGSQPSRRVPPVPASRRFTLGAPCSSSAHDVTIFPQVRRRANSTHISPPCPLSPFNSTSAPPPPSHSALAVATSCVPLPSPPSPVLCPLPSARCTLPAVPCPLYPARYTRSALRCPVRCRCPLSALSAGWRSQCPHSATSPPAPSAPLLPHVLNSRSSPPQPALLHRLCPLRYAAKRGTNSDKDLPTAFEATAN